MAAILEGFANNDRNKQLEAVEMLKKQFKHPDRIFSKVKLESLLHNARVSIKNKPPESDFLSSYSNSLVGFLGKDPNLDPEILQNLEIISNEFPQKDEIITKLWSKLDKYPDEILKGSKSTLEKTVLEWVVNAPDARMELLSKISVNSPKLFQTLTSILYEVLVRTDGHVRGFEVTSSFLESVKRECKKKEKSVLALYPRGCRRLVSLMRCPPGVCKEGFDDTREKVVGLLLDLFLTDRKSALILLSHYTEWVRIFRDFLEGKDLENQ